LPKPTGTEVYTWVNAEQPPAYSVTCFDHYDTDTGIHKQGG
jgi:hypothetical protein